MGKLQALKHNVPYLKIHAKGILLFPNIYLSTQGTVPSSDYHSTSYFLSSLSNGEEWKLRTLYMRKALLFYLNCLAAFHKEVHLFIT